MLIIDVLIGLGIFLFGMMQLEQGIEQANSRWIKQWLSHNTDRPLKSVFAGTVITAIMQSSSMVSLIILAFASAGLIPLMNAVGVLLGANLGTTFTGWVVTTLGFKLNLESVALPMVGIGALLQVFAEKQSKLNAIGKTLFGFGMLIFGLSIMKDSVSALPEQIELSQLQQLNAFSFLILGTLLTAVIQSSSATMMIALTALNSEIIGLPGAAALIIGANLGTTSTTALGSIKGSPIKRQLALAHISFNLVTDLLAFVFLLPLLPALLGVLGITDPLYGLVVFHSSFNVLGLLLFVPILRYFSQWLSHRFVDEGVESRLTDVPVSVTEAAIKQCRIYVNDLLSTAIAINVRNLRIDNQLTLTANAHTSLKKGLADGKSFEQRYELLKHKEGELLVYASKIQTQALDELQSKQLNSFIACAREAVITVKSLKDIRVNLIQLRHTKEPVFKTLQSDYQTKLIQFYKVILELVATDHDKNYVREQLENLKQLNDNMHAECHMHIQTYTNQQKMSANQLSSLFNLNREVWQSGKTMIEAFTFWYQL